MVWQTYLLLEQTEIKVKAGLHVHIIHFLTYNSAFTFISAYPEFLSESACFRYLLLLTYSDHILNLAVLSKKKPIKISQNYHFLLTILDIQVRLLALPLYHALLSKLLSGYWFITLMWDLILINSHRLYMLKVSINAVR